MYTFCFFFYSRNDWSRVWEYSTLHTQSLSVPRLTLPRRAPGQKVDRNRSRLSGAREYRRGKDVVCCSWYINIYIYVLVCPYINANTYIAEATEVVKKTCVFIAGEKTVTLIDFSRDLIAPNRFYEMRMAWVFFLFRTLRFSTWDFQWLRFFLLFSIPRITFMTDFQKPNVTECSNFLDRLLKL